MAEAQAAAGRQSLNFQTEAKQILHLMIHSLYTHKEVFIRELISNASDALDRLRFESLTNPSLIGGNGELAIRIKLDPTAKTLTISDNGIGMTKQEVIENIGTIARSGSKAFLEKLTGDQKADSNLIGQFGVGFYSTFMVASQVKLVTKRAQEPAAVWESSGENDYTIEETESKTSRGTDITVYLKDDETTFAEHWNVRSIIKKYSDFIAFPIYLPDEKGKDEVVNQTKPIWGRAASDITTEQYEEFYQQALAGFDKPLAILHNKAEGVMEYSSLLYLPAATPFDLFSVDRKHGVKLYVKRVFILDNCKELLPDYLRFVKGVVDSEDLPLNVSREILQKNPVVERIKKSLVGKILAKLAEMAESEPEKYRTFWKSFGSVIKEGIHIDPENKEKLLELLRFQSSMGATKDDLVSLKTYVSRMRPDQKEIYYIAGESREIAEKSPHLEVFKAKSIEVLYLLDPIDEWIVPDVYTYDSKKLKAVTQGDLDLGELGKDENDARKKAESKLKKLSERIKNILSDNVKEVRITTRLKDSPACLVTDENAPGVHMEKIMKAMGQEVPAAKRILEINAEHPIIDNLNTRYKKDPKDADLDEWVHLLYEQALIAEGQMVPDPLAYSRRVNSLLLKASSS
jgi:molecular chaperone HtpG